MVRDENAALYTGITTDVERRFAEHVKGGSKAAKYLRAKKELELVYRCKIGEKREAARFEYHLKTLEKKKKEEIVKRQMGKKEVSEFLFRH
jgi:putative endonuclease